MSYPVMHVFAGDVLPIMFASYAGATGASVTLTGLAVTDIEIYKDGSTTQRASDNGYTLLDTDGIDFDSITGIHGFSIDTGDNSDASFYTVGAWFTVVVSAVTIDSQTVNFIAAMFRIMPAESVAGKPKVDTDTFGGTAGTFSSGRPEANTTHIAGSAVSTSSAQIGVNVVNAGATAWGSGAITAGSIASDAITAAKIADGAIDAATFATGAITAAAIAADAIGASELAADAVTEIQSGLATASALATVSSKIDTVDDFVDTEVAAILAAVDTEVAAIKAVTDLLPNAGALSSLATASALTTVSGKIDTVDDFVDTEVAAIKTVVDAIKAKTDSLVFTVANVVDANIQRVNDVTVTGTGASGDEWGP